MSITTVRDVEQGRVRPSDGMRTRLTRGLNGDRAALTLAVLDLRLRRLAGPSLRPWVRRRPPRVATQRLYEQVGAVLDAEDSARREETCEFLEAFTEALTGDAPLTQGPAETGWPLDRVDDVQLGEASGKGQDAR